MRYLLLTAALLLNLCCLVSAKISQVNHQVYFESDKHVLNESEKARLKAELENLLFKNKYVEIDLTGFTDSDAGANYNVTLSKQRAIEVKQFLVECGITEKSISIAYKGERLPAATNNTPNGKSKNRRVEIAFRIYTFENASELIKDLNAAKVQTFNCNSEKPFEVKGESGIKLFFEPDCFFSKTGKNFDKKNVKVELVEIKTLPDALLNNVLTEADQRILQSGGMYRVVATFEGDTLELKQGMTYRAEIANSRLLDGMSVFVGSNQPDGLLAWSNTSTPFTATRKYNGDMIPLQIDEKSLSNWNIAILPESYRKEFYTKLPPEGDFLDKPVRPRKPADLDLKAYEYLIPWYKRVFMSEKRKEAELIEICSGILNNYEMRLDRYDTKLEKFENDSIKWAASNGDSYKRRLEYKNQLIRAYDKLQKYKLAYLQAAISAKFNETKNDLVRLNQQGRLYTSPIEIMEIAIKPIANARNIEFPAGLLVFEAELRERLIKYSRNCDHLAFYRAINGGTGTILKDYVFKTAPYRSVAIAEEKRRNEEIRTGRYNPANFQTYYSAELNQMGWINCDRFYNVPQEQMITLRVPPLSHSNLNVFAVIDEIGSNMGMVLKPSGYELSVPRRKAVTIVAVGVNNELKPVLAVKKVKHPTIKPEELEFKEVTLEELKLNLMQL